MDKGESCANWIKASAKVFGLIAALLAGAAVFCPFFVRAQSAETDAAEQQEDLVVIRVEARREETDTEALLLRINAVRREACEEGVDSPVDGMPLTPADYVPLQWSEALEDIALQRAAESMVLQDHIRPDGTECFTAAPEGVSFTMETLAWGFDSAEDALEGWYSEKTSYLNADGRPAGHYMALINPENRFVGIAGLGGKWQRNACAGAFGREAGTKEPEAAETGGGEGSGAVARGEPAGDGIWLIPVRRDLLPAVIERAVEISAGRITRNALSVRCFGETAGKN